MTKERRLNAGVHKASTPRSSACTNTSMGRGRSSARTEQRETDSTLGRKLTKLLRHRIHENGLSSVLRPDGFVPLNAILALQNFQGVDPAAVAEAVRVDGKQRMSLLEEDGELYIRCNQGHSFSQGLDAEALLAPLDECAAAALGEGSGLAVHGTYHRAWPAIVESGGLKRMARTHIHLARGLPGESGIISGMRASSEIVIWVDVAAATRAGVRFYESANGVVLTAGHGTTGTLPLRFFQRVVDTASGSEWLDGVWRHRDGANACNDRSCSSTARNGAHVSLRSCSTSTPVGAIGNGDQRPASMSDEYACASSPRARGRGCAGRGRGRQGHGRNAQGGKGAARVQHEFLS